MLVWEAESDEDLSCDVWCVMYDQYPWAVRDKRETLLEIDLDVCIMYVYYVRVLCCVALYNILCTAYHVKFICIVSTDVPWCAVEVAAKY